jgi:Pyridoxamine 5'-phosphate oxidase
MNLVKSTKFRNVLKNNKVAIVIDDFKSVDPWVPRGIRIYGTADTVTRHGGYIGELKNLYSCKESSMLKKQRKSSGY